MWDQKGTLETHAYTQSYSRAHIHSKNLHFHVVHLRSLKKHYDQLNLIGTLKCSEIGVPVNELKSLPNKSLYQIRRVHILGKRSLFGMI